LVLLDQLLIGVCDLRILVEVPHVCVGRRVIQVEVVLLDVFAVIALAAGQAEHPLLEEWISAVPQCQGKTQVLMPVAYAGQAVLVPAVGAGAGGVVRKRPPGIAARRVVLAYGPPGALADVRPPEPPLREPLVRRGEASVLCGGVDRCMCRLVHGVPRFLPQ